MKALSIDRKTCCLFAALCGLTVCGCVRETTDGATKIYSYEAWIPWSILLAGVAVVPLGWFLRKTSARWGWALLLGGPIAALFFAPSLMFDFAKVSPDRYYHQSGIWGLTLIHEVNLQELAKVTVIAREETGRRGQKVTKYYLLCEKKDGSTQEMLINNEVAENAAPEFILQLKARNIPVIDQT